ncbi:MAG: lipid-A-disaccharide synthase [Saprospiraceae bacterium]|nr:lipid-A-disaccharide synthase [Saprospiraceae bacterium]
MKYYLIAGEASGDMHGANLMRALKDKDADAEFRFWGGDKMQQAGGVLVKHYRDTAYMGFIEVFKNLKSILSNLTFCKKDLLHYDPDYIIFIDYPGFNIRVAKWARKKRIRAKLVYYISPQVWAWKPGRANDLRDILDQMYVILPFEPAFYAKYGFEVTYVGHPLFDHLQKLEYPQTLQQKYDLPDLPVIAILPGSRQQEIKKLLEIMIAMVPLFQDYQFVIAAVSTVPETAYQRARDRERVSIISDDTNLVLHSSEAALVASGTATLEAALMHVPQVVCYRGGSLNYQIAKRLIDVKYISLVNLIIDEPLVVELIQNQLTKESLHKALTEILTESGRKRLISGYAGLADKLGGPGASQRVASGIVQMLPG